MLQKAMGDSGLVCSALGFGTWELSTTQYGAIDVAQARVVQPLQRSSAYPKPRQTMPKNSSARFRAEGRHTPEIQFQLWPSPWPGKGDVAVETSCGPEDKTPARYQ